MDDQEEMTRQDEELRHERLKEDEVEAEIDSFFSRTANRNLWRRMFVLLGIVTGVGLFCITIYIP